jgi:signal transduction histidine kinase
MRALLWVMRPSLLATLDRRPRPRRSLVVLVGLGCLAAETLAGAALTRLVPVQSLGVLYLPGVLLMASLWGLLPGLAMAVASTVAFDLFLVPPAWTLRLSRPEDLSILGLFVATTILACVLTRAVRLLTIEAEAREEADLSTEMARLLLRAPELQALLPAAAQRLAESLRLPSAVIEPGDVPADESHLAFPLRGRCLLATLLVPHGLPRPVLRRIRDRVVPSLEVLLDAAWEREQAADALRAGRDRLARVADEQSALRRIAMLVAHGAPDSEVFSAVAREMGQMIDAHATVVVRYEPVMTAVVVGNWGRTAEDRSGAMPLGSRWTLEKGTVIELVARTGAPGRIDSYAEGDGHLVTWLRSRGVLSAVGCPVVVGRSLWGVTVASSASPEPLPDDTEVRMMEFTELAAAAIANAQTSADLEASRARVVAAADETRHRVERDLHDRTQRRLVSLGLRLNVVQAAIPAELTDVRLRLARTSSALEAMLAGLRELRNGLHPEVLAEGGLERALTVLARRSPVPVELDVSTDGRLPERYGMTVCDVVSEALANVAEHASASVVHVALAAEDRMVRLAVRDDGVGGADPERGSGLIGLTDRVEAMGGGVSVVSPTGGGTSLLVEMPIG